jgi:release factor glutamine methyltransferase
MTIRYSQDQIAKSKEISKKNMDIQNPSIFELCGERFILLPHVFSPILFPSAKIYYPKFPYQKEESFLEIGCGAGYGSILALKNGAKHVVATDINPAAIENARLNTKLHKVEDKIEIIESDLFENVKGKYSTIYWNHPFITVPDGYVFENIIERAIFDPGYKLLDKFLDEARDYLISNGRVLIGLADVGGLDYFRELVERYRYSEKEILREGGIEGNKIQITLHELRVKQKV